MTRRLTLYSRRDCGLCGAMKRIIEQAAASIPVVMEEVDVDTDPTLREEFGGEVPVLFIDGRKAFKYRVSLKELRQRLR